MTSLLSFPWIIPKGAFLFEATRTILNMVSRNSVSTDQLFDHTVTSVATIKLNLREIFKVLYLSSGA